MTTPIDRAAVDLASQPRAWIPAARARKEPLPAESSSGRPRKFDPHPLSAEALKAAAWYWAQHQNNGYHPEKLKACHFEAIASALDVSSSTVLRAVTRADAMGEEPMKPGALFTQSPINRYGLWLLLQGRLPASGLARITSAPLSAIEKLAADDPEKMFANYAKARLQLIRDILSPVKGAKSSLSQTSLHGLREFYEEERKAVEAGDLSQFNSKPAIAVATVRRIATMRAGWLEHPGLGHNAVDRGWRTPEKAALRAATRHRARRQWLDENLGPCPAAVHFNQALNDAGLASYCEALSYGPESTNNWLALEILCARAGIVERQVFKGAGEGGNYAPLIEHINPDGRHTTAGACVDAMKVVLRQPQPYYDDLFNMLVFSTALFGNDPTNPLQIQTRCKNTLATFRPTPWSW